MVTLEQALTARDFHENGCTRHVGPRGGVKETVRSWRRNGATQTWKTRPGEFRVPIKWGLKTYGQLWHYNASEWHTAEECPLREGSEN